MMKSVCLFCEFDQCDICSAGPASDSELCQGVPFDDALLDSLEGGDPDG